MESKSSPTLPVAQSNEPEVTVRRSANYAPCIWGDQFLIYGSVEIDVEMEQQIEQLKQRVREMLVASVDKSSQKLSLIDAIERLGVAYHFETEIETALQDIYDTYHDIAKNEDLYTVALFIRLLRQQGHPVSCGIPAAAGARLYVYHQKDDVFNKFKDKEGKFQESVAGSVRGMLSLYEATHLSMHGEDILDEALDFTSSRLKSALQNLSSNPIVEQVVHALDTPIHKGLPRIEARRYISLYEQDDSIDKTLLRFAKLDFNHLQKLHQAELSELTRWWKDLGFANKLPFMRDRLVEHYFCWTMCIYFEPHYSVGRKTLSKVTNLATVLDDLYDTYGTMDELVLLTNTIRRWDTKALDQLLDYLKLFCQAFFDVYKAIEDEMDKEGKSYATDCLKSTMLEVLRSYMTEAKWYHEGYVPSLEEYMSVATVSSWYGSLVPTSFLADGEMATKEAFDWISSWPLILRASSVICRLMDDIVTHKAEQERGDVPSAIECYMKQHDVTEDQAVIELEKQIANAWKDINAECLHPTAVLMPLLRRVLNYTRVMHVFYRGKDHFTNSGTLNKDLITSVLIDSVPIK